MKWYVAIQSYKMQALHSELSRFSYINPKSLLWCISRLISLDNLLSKSWRIQFREDRSTWHSHKQVLDLGNRLTCSKFCKPQPDPFTLHKRDGRSSSPSGQLPLSLCSRLMVPWESCHIKWKSSKDAGAGVSIANISETYRSTWRKDQAPSSHAQPGYAVGREFWKWSVHTVPDHQSCMWVFQLLPLWGS